VTWTVPEFFVILALFAALVVMLLVLVVRSLRP